MVIGPGSHRSRERTVALAATVVALAATVLGLLWIERQGRAVEIEGWRARMSAMASDRTLAIESWVRGTGADLRILRDAYDSVEAGPGSGQHVGGGATGAALTRVVSSHEEYDAAWVIGEDGITASVGAPPPSNAESDLARMVVSGGSMRALFFILDSGSVVTFAAPVRQAAVVIRVDPEHFLFPLLAAEPVATETGETLLAQFDGDSVVFLNPLRKAAGLPTTVRRSAKMEQLAATAALKGEETFGEFRDYQGTPILAVTRRLESVPWGLVTKVDRREALADRRGEMALLVLLTLGLVAAVVGATTAYWIYRRDREHQAALEALRESEAKFRRLFDQSRDAIFLTAADGRILDVNTACLELFEIEPDRLHEHAAHDFYRNPADREHFRTLMLENGGVSDFEVELVTTTGRPFFGLYSAATVHDADGALVGFQGTVRDITERLENERQIRESEERLRLTHEHAPIGIGHMALDGTFIRVNRALYELVGYSRAELIGRTFQEITHPDDVDEDVALARQLLEGEIPSYELEKRYIHKEGHAVWAHLTGSLVRQPDGSPLHFLAHVRDIDERVRIRRQLEESEHRFRSLIENASELISIVDLEGRLTYVSPAYGQVMGYDLAELADRDAFELVHPEDVPALVKEFDALAANPGAQAMAEFRFRDAGGTWRILEARGTNLLEDPAVGGIVINSRDVTDRREAEEELRRKAEEQEAILATITEAVVLVDSSGSLSYANPAAERILGITAGNDPGRTYNDPQWEITALDGGTFPDEELPFVRVMETGNPVYGVRHGIQRPDGPAILSINAAPLRDDEDRIAGMVASVQDVTERVEAEREVRRLNEELEQRVEERTAELEAANEELESFAYSVSHDLRAPLRAIHGFSDALIEDYRDRLDGEAFDFLGRIQANSQRMSQLIDDILKLSRVSRKELRREPVDLVRLARGTVEELRQIEPDRPVELATPDTLPATGDPKLLPVVMENLIGNAWKFSRDEAVARIELVADEANGERIYRVRDNGVGFDMTYAHKLFKAFHRLHRDSEFEGTGIGLATVNRIVRRHGGWVEAEGAVGEGATITFSLGESAGGRAGSDGPDTGSR